jgi:hypothetical protein
MVGGGGLTAAAFLISVVYKSVRMQALEDLKAMCCCRGCRFLIALNLVTCGAAPGSWRTVNLARG